MRTKGVDLFQDGRQERKTGEVNFQWRNGGAVDRSIGDNLKVDMEGKGLDFEGELVRLYGDLR